MKANHQKPARDMSELWEQHDAAPDCLFPVAFAALAAAVVVAAFLVLS